MPERVLFWTSAALLTYTYVGYPVLVFIWAAFRTRPSLVRSNMEPLVTLIIVAHNEAPRIARRIENLLSLDYPADRREILIGSDGSTDGTAERARQYESAGVGVIAYETRRGKAAVLNDLVGKARGEIVVFGDARQRFDSGALRALAAHFADPSVGAVSGELILSEDPSDTAVGRGVGFYWRYEKFIRRHEARVDSAVSVTGAIYAIRRCAFEPVPPHTILDDVVIPVRIAARGYRVLFEPGARAYDRAAATAHEELTRKVRTITGQFQLFSREGWLLDPSRNRLWLQTVSHVALRLVIPVLAVVALTTTIVLREELFYRGALLAQLLFYVAAFGGFLLRRARRTTPVLSVPYTVCLLNWATVVAFVRFVTRGQSVTWDRAAA